MPNPTPTPTPSENFDGGTTGPNFTPGTLTTTPTSNNPNVTVTVQNGQLVITPLSGANGANFNGIVLVKPIDLNVTPTVSIEAVQVQDEGTTSFALGNDPNNWYRFAAGTDDSLNQNGASQANGKRSVSGARAEAVKLFFFQTNLGGTKFSTPGVPYDPVKDRFWRFRFGEPTAAVNAEAPVINFETSADAKVKMVAELLEITNILDLYPPTLSGGQQQRVRRCNLGRRSLTTLRCRRRGWR